jgi:hypothetical protein
MLGVWLAVVIVATTRHEYWRDEVRAWSLAREAISPLDLFHLIRYEGHPVLWYLLLYIGKSITDTPLVLPITSLAVATAAAALFMFRAPFPLWMKALFLFSALPLYEYSVMARNYGISMLLVFAAASIYRHRKKYWLPLAVVLALLANTNIHATVLAFMIAGAWAWDEARLRKVAPDQALGTRILTALAIVGAGILLSLVVVSPPPDTILTGFYSTTAGSVASAFLGAVFRPGDGFYTLFPAFVPALVGSVVLYLAVFGLMRRPALFLAALAGLVILGVLFRVAYEGSYRHAGVFFCFLLSLYWMAIDARTSDATPKLQQRFFSVGLYGALPLLILAGVYKDRAIRVDVDLEMSSSKAFGAFLAASPEYRDAILVPEPDFAMESVLYYARNRVSFPRERRFGTTVTWSTVAAADLSLGQLVTHARNLKAQHGRPVLLVLGHAATAIDATGDIEYSYNKRFTWNAGEHMDFEQSTTPVAEFLNSVRDEKYWVYAVK